MGERTIKAPELDWLTEEEAVAWLRLDGAAFRTLVNKGAVAGVCRINRQTVRYHWKGLVMLQWRMELADLPTEKDEGAAKVPS